MAEAEETTTSRPNYPNKILEDGVDDDDSGITMIDVLEEEQELEEDANAVLGASDDQNCTYPQGYVKRQALYACKTCTADKQILAGICLACSYACHEGHELLELYTKRNFRCECGNQKFPSNLCKLYQKKTPLNDNNVHNQNFKGVYCVCGRPYPDPENEVDDEMIQCIVCEDWYHGRHLDTPAPAEQDYGEMICNHCMEKCDFLRPYAVNQSNSIVKIQKECENDNDLVDVGIELNEKADTQESLLKGTQINDYGPRISDKELNSNISEIKESIPAASCSTQSEVCELAKLTKTTGDAKGAAFLPDGWREKLCTCDNCKALYKEKSVLFLLDRQDTVHAYEERGKAKQSGQSQYDQGMKALSQMDRVSQVEAIHEYNNMKTELKDFLKSFAENKKVVRKEDIDEFFNQMNERKKRRLNVNIPDFCR